MVKSSEKLNLKFIIKQTNQQKIKHKGKKERNINLKRVKKLLE